ncbi:stalk domain-containing protein, partial [Peptoniphilus lacrimalis]|uniref:stalk domain-containing protein n=2 Tax=Peptoniphilus lacrimalis TaxID=33031 RepID=UPI00254B55A3
EIDKLPNLSDDEKDKYKKQVDEAQTKGDVEKAVEDAKAKDAENKNAADEKNKPATADDKNKAKDEIDKLPNLSDDEKDKYKKQVDEAQTKGDVAKIVDEAKAKSGVPAPEPSPTPNPSVDRDHDYWYRPYWTYSYGTSNTTIQKPVKTNLVKLESKLVIGSKEMVKSVDGVEQKINMDIAPFIEGNRTMLPIRFVAESLGFNVQWDKESRTVILIDKENVVKIPVDTNQIIVNGKVYESDVKPVIRNNRTMLPIANIARALGLKDGTDIIWNAATKEVKINREIEK